jgi:hypothetical protein
LVTGVGKPARKYQSFPRCVRMPGVSVTLAYAKRAKAYRALGDEAKAVSDERKGQEPSK